MKNAPEIEAKFRLLQGQRETLLARLGNPARVLHQCDEYFDVPGRVLRIRLENGSPLLTRKDRGTITPDGIKSRLEVEHPIPEGFVPQLADLLVWLGHGKLITVQKERLEYDRPGFLVCVDRIAELEPPDFVELESTGGDIEGLRELRDHLGLSAAQIESRSYASMVADLKGGSRHRSKR